MPTTKSIITQVVFNKCQFEKDIPSTPVVIAMIKIAIIRALMR